MKSHRICKAVSRVSHFPAFQPMFLSPAYVSLRTEWAVWTTTASFITCWIAFQTGSSVGADKACYQVSFAFILDRVVTLPRDEHHLSISRYSPMSLCVTVNSDLAQYICRQKRKQLTSHFQYESAVKITTDMFSEDC